MNETGKSLWGKLGLLIGLAILCHPVAGADRVYKCVEGGKTRFTSNPGEAGRNCQPLELHVPQPDPAEVARQAEKNRAEAAREKAEAARLREVIKNDPDAWPGPAHGNGEELGAPARAWQARQKKAGG